MLVRECIFYRIDCLPDLFLSSDCCGTVAVLSTVTSELRVVSSFKDVFKVMLRSVCPAALHMTPADDLILRSNQQNLCLCIGQLSNGIRCQ